MKILKRTGPKSVIRHLGLPETSTFMYGGKPKKKRRGSKMSGMVSTAGTRRTDTIPLRQLEERNSYYYRSDTPRWRNIDMREMANFMSSRQPPPNFNRSLLSFTTAELNESNRKVADNIARTNALRKKIYNRKWKGLKRAFGRQIMSASVDADLFDARHQDMLDELGLYHFHKNVEEVLKNNSPSPDSDKEDELTSFTPTRFNFLTLEDGISYLTSRQTVLEGKEGREAEEALKEVDKELGNLKRQKTQMKRLGQPLSQWENTRLKTKVPQSSLKRTAQSPYPASPESRLGLGLKLFPTPKEMTPNPGPGKTSFSPSPNPAGRPTESISWEDLRNITVA